VLATVEALIPPLSRSEVWRRLRNRPPAGSEAYRGATVSVHVYPYVVVIERGTPPALRERASGARLLGGRTLA